MQAPLGNLIRKMLSNEETSKQLMKHIIIGKRFTIDEPIEFDHKKIRVVRAGSITPDFKK